MILITLAMLAGGIVQVAAAKASKPKVGSFFIACGYATNGSAFCRVAVMTPQGMRCGKATAEPLTPLVLASAGLMGRCPSARRPGA